MASSSKSQDPVPLFLGPDDPRVFLGASHPRPSPIKEVLDDASNYGDCFNYCHCIAGWPLQQAKARMCASLTMQGRRFGNRYLCNFTRGDRRELLVGRRALVVVTICC